MLRANCNKGDSLLIHSGRTKLFSRNSIRAGYRRGDDETRPGASTSLGVLGALHASRITFTIVREMTMVQ